MSFSHILTATDFRLLALILSEMALQKILEKYIHVVEDLFKI